MSQVDLRLWFFTDVSTAIQPQSHLAGDEPVLETNMEATSADEVPVSPAMSPPIVISGSPLLQSSASTLDAEELEALEQLRQELQTDATPYPPAIDIDLPPPDSEAPDPTLISSEAEPAADLEPSHVLAREEKGQPRACRWDEPLPIRSSCFG